jgi:DNA-binding NtrC family response regulator
MSKTPEGWHEAVARFKRELLTRTLQACCGNRSEAARMLRLQRTYLLKLIHEFRVTVAKGGRDCKDTDGRSVGRRPRDR